MEGNKNYPLESHILLAAICFSCEAVDEQVLFVVTRSSKSLTVISISLTNMSFDSQVFIPCINLSLDVMSVYR